MSGGATPEERLAALGLTLPAVAPPGGSYVPARRTGSYVYTSGQLPFGDGKLPTTGKVGAEVSLEEARDLARLCALNALAAAAQAAGGQSALTRSGKGVGFVARAPRGSSTGPAICSPRCSARPVSTPAARSGWRSCRSTRRSRWS